MEFNKEIPIAENYKFNRMEYDHVLISIHEIWVMKETVFNISSYFYGIIRNVWSFGLFH